MGQKSTDHNQPIDPKWGKPDPTHDPYALANFQPRPTDVLITTAPKAGTTWMQQILYQLRSGGDDQFKNIYDVVPWLEMPQPGKSWHEVLEEFERIPDPRIFKTHCTYEQTPGVDTVRIILTSRHPCDSCVSFYHHIMNLTEEHRENFQVMIPDSVDEYVDKWLEAASWYRNVKSWWPHHEQNNILWLRYEDLVADLETGMRQILNFLGWQRSESQFTKALEYSSFKWMKQHADRFTAEKDGKPVFKPGKFIRKGQVGDSKNLLSPEHEKKILDKAFAELDEDCLRFLGLK